MMSIKKIVVLLCSMLLTILVTILGAIIIFTFVTYIIDTERLASGVLLDDIDINTCNDYQVTNNIEYNCNIKHTYKLKLYKSNTNESYINCNYFTCKYCKDPSYKYKIIHNNPNICDIIDKFKVKKLEYNNIQNNTLKVLIILIVIIFIIILLIILFLVMYVNHGKLLQCIMKGIGYIFITVFKHTNVSNYLSQLL